MWSKTKELSPVIVVVILLACGAAYYANSQISALQTTQQQELNALRLQHAADLQASAEQTRLQIEAGNSQLKASMEKRSADPFMNEEKITQFATTIAMKMQPYTSLPKTPAEAERRQTEQNEKISSHLAERLQPILADLAKEQNLSRESLTTYSQKIYDAVGNQLVSLMAQNWALHDKITTTQAVARDSLALTQELTALYLSTFKDQGVITRIFALPANILHDASQLSVLSSTERKKLEVELLAKMAALQQRLNAQTEPATQTEPAAQIEPAAAM